MSITFSFSLYIFLYIKQDDGPRESKHVAYTKIHSCVWRY